MKYLLMLGLLIGCTQYPRYSLGDIVNISEEFANGFYSEKCLGHIKGYSNLTERYIIDIYCIKNNLENYRYHDVEFIHPKYLTPNNEARFVE